MSNSVKKGSAPSDKKQTKEYSSVQAYLAKKNEAQRSRIGKVITLLLYQFAFNGKVSGRMDGNVLMKNGRGRKMTVPSLVQNGYTQAQRSSVSSISSSWNSLTQEEMLTWINAEGWTATNRFGTEISVKGKELYVRLNQNLFNIGGTPLTECPARTAVLGITDMSLAAAAGAGTLAATYSPTPTEANVDHLVFATAGKSAGTFKPSRSAYRLIGVITNTSASPKALGTQYVAKFGAMVAGTKIFVKVVPIETTTGQAGIEMVASDIVAA